MTKIEADVLDRLDFQDWAVLTDPTERVLNEVAQTSGARALAVLRIDDKDKFEQADAAAVKYASERAAALVGVGDYSVSEATRDMLRATITTAVDDGWSTGKLRDEIRDNYAFSHERAETIARTEVADAHEAGNMAGWIASGVVETVEWEVSDDEPCDDCQENGDAGPVPLGDEFPSGDTQPTAHPRCECALVANVADEEDDTEKVEKADDRRRVARVIIIEDDGRVWLFAPFNEPYVMFPGGGVDDGEAFSDAAVREAREETGLEVEIIRSLGSFDDEFAQRQYYVARRVGGEPTVVDEDGGGLVRVYRATVAEALESLTSPHDIKAALTLWIEEQDNGKP